MLNGRSTLGQRAGEVGLRAAGDLTERTVVDRPEGVTSADDAVSPVEAGETPSRATRVSGPIGLSTVVFVRMIPG